MKLPLLNKIKGKENVAKGLLQDILIGIVYNLELNAVLHGGTSIWRCFNGNRFSDDLDFYLVPKPDFEDSFKLELIKNNLTLLKYKSTENTIFSKISNSSVEVKLEVSFQNKKGEVIAYEKIDGSFIDVLSLTTEQIFLEKLETYSNRKLVRDLYDIYHLSHLFDLSQEQRHKLKLFLSHLEKPVDPENLASIVLVGVAPTYENILIWLKRLS